ncbi:hypothetical protein RDV89_06450 [Nocardioides zeae]|uniref:Uncharacterized protein n=1 Tax=Nocardioides imazamoxiresistens TaxID=3231893 RepID=A0ABU3PTZ7_9ACTN|nr:hypothetical protein [Nocardioides zeae]MDT9592698.1 hypothetical protein [Nocardioides zeae]
MRDDDRGPAGDATSETERLRAELDALRATLEEERATFAAELRAGAAELAALRTEVETAREQRATLRRQLGRWQRELVDDAAPPTRSRLRARALRLVRSNPRAELLARRVRDALQARR